ncbi:hypothetical protein NQ317_006984 [Molorchus minor]|uniref:Very-long-chain 3-oxoacyl-CoA synthase n=1 Tax=Molorchus minor TaxID=1323400 RepID=A0ABQ9ITJ6_9CUCU|nr:hypothetical protein NQ317_006984 [Molorchus minor]
MSGPGPTLLITVFYILSVLVFLPAYMKNKKPYKLRAIIRYYNIFQIVSCCSIIYMLNRKQNVKKFRPGRLHELALLPGGGHFLETFTRCRSFV